MVQRCSVPLCETKVGDVDLNGAKVRFHRIPLIPEKFVKWREKITNSGEYKPVPDLTVNSRICSKHFLREDYISVEEQKPGTSGNHVLAKDALPTIFKWNDHSGNQCEISRAIPYVKKSTKELSSSSNGHSGMELTRNQEIQCSLEEEKLQQELYRKNLIIRQLLQRLAEVEDSAADPVESPPPVVTLTPIPSPPTELLPTMEIEKEAEIQSTSKPCEPRNDPELSVIASVPTKSPTINPDVSPPRVSVIRRVCDINKPPKKRKIIFDEYY